MRFHERVSGAAAKVRDVERGERIVGENRDLGAAGQRGQHLLGSEHRQRAFQPPQVERRRGGVFCGAPNDPILGSIRHGQREKQDS
jgi:hypothetical protein